MLIGSHKAFQNVQVGSSVELDSVFEGPSFTGTHAHVCTLRPRRVVVEGSAASPVQTDTTISVYFGLSRLVSFHFACPPCSPVQVLAYQTRRADMRRYLRDTPLFF